jgi:hypothetical protein
MTRTTKPPDGSRKPFGTEKIIRRKLPFLGAFFYGKSESVLTPRTNTESCAKNRKKHIKKSKSGHQRTYIKKALYSAEYKALKWWR